MRVGIGVDIRQHSILGFVLYITPPNPHMTWQWGEDIIYEGGHGQRYWTNLNFKFFPISCPTPTLYDDDD